jgi:WD40 repeat protein
LELNLDYANDKSEENRSKSLKEIETIESAHDDDINFVSFHPNKNLLASCSDDNFIKIWDLNIK